MSIVAKFMDKIEYCPHCGSATFHPVLGFKQKISAGVVNGIVDECVNNYCKAHIGVSPEDFNIDLTIIDPQDLASEYQCDCCNDTFCKGDCVCIEYDGEDYKPGDDIEKLVIDIFEQTTGIYFPEMELPIREQLPEYIDYWNFEYNCIWALMTKEFVFFNDIEDELNVESSHLTLNHIVKYYCAHRKDLDEYANMSIIEKLGYKKEYDQLKEKSKLVSDQLKEKSKLVTSSETFKKTTSIVKDTLGLEDKDIKKAKSFFKSLFD